MSYEKEISQYFKLLSKVENKNFKYEDHIVLLTFDDNYVDQTINLILSIAKYHPQNVSYICMCPSLKESNIKSLLCLKQGIQVNCYEYTPIVDSGKWPHCTLFRLFAAWLLEDKVKKVLYMDSDILCTGSLKMLFDTDVQHIAMCNEIGGNAVGRVFRELMSVNIYCNSGVAVFNLETLRKEYSFNILCEALIDVKENLVFPDQDFLNLFYLGKVQVLNGIEFNFQPYEFRHSKYYRAALSRCKLIHFASSKPWSYKCELYVIRLYLKHSQHPAMIAKVKKALWLSCLHSVVRLNRPLQRRYYQFIAARRK